MLEVTLITPTADRPAGLALCEQMMRRQTIWGDIPVEWIVADNGSEPAQPTMGQRVLSIARCNRQPSEVFCEALLSAISHVRTDYVAFIEDDDWYGERHLEDILSRLQSGADIAGDCIQRYYHLPQKCWTRIGNLGACLAQTALHSRLLPTFAQKIAACRAVPSHGCDTVFWRWCLRNVRCDVYREGQVVGIKGLPGRRGLGIGHRPDSSWRPDPRGIKLRQWVGRDAEMYEALMHEHEVTALP